jgi:hypothetical protein
VFCATAADWRTLPFEPSSRLRFVMKSDERTKQWLLRWLTVKGLNPVDEGKVHQHRYTTVYIGYDGPTLCTDATTCFSCGPPEVNLAVIVYMQINQCHRVKTQLQLIIIIIIIIIITHLFRLLHV